jgi:DNA polymerase (family X)
VQDAKQVARCLGEIAGLLRVADESKFKIAAFEKAARTVSALGDQLGVFVAQGRLQELEGVGATLAREIEELWRKGGSDYLVRLRSEQPEGAAELIQVEGLTPRRIRALAAELGIRSVEQLRAACAAGHVRGLPGFGAKTEQKLLEASDHFLTRGDLPATPLLLPDALDTAAAVAAELRGVLPEVQLAGAARRGEETVAGLDFVVRGEPGSAWQRLRELGLVGDIHEAAHSGNLSNGFPLRLHVARGGFGNAFVLATGNAAHLAAVGERAQARGFAIARAPDGSGEVRDFADEAALYAALGVAFVPPELRTGRDELELAQHDDFSDLLTVDDVQGMVHCHTNYSDGRDTIAAMAAAAHAMGMRYITITDHSASAHYAGGLSADRLKQQRDEIAAAQEQVPIRILQGTESDILADGALDYSDAVLAQLDVIIASIHMRHRMDRTAMTERLRRALGLPLFKIWGHALGRILNERDPIDCDVETVLDVLAGSRGAIEVNSDPRRLDLPPAWIPAARARGIPFVISTDAHSTDGLGVLRYGVTMARRGGLRKHEVLNTRSADDFAAAVRPVG